MASGGVCLLHGKLMGGATYYTSIGVQKTTLWLRIFIDYAKRVGYAGTWGAGFNGQNTIHVRDMADVVLLIFKAAIEGHADEGANGFCESHENIGRAEVA